MRLVETKKRDDYFDAPSRATDSSEVKLTVPEMGKSLFNALSGGAPPLNPGDKLKLGKDTQATVIDIGRDVDDRVWIAKLSCLGQEFSITI